MKKILCILAIILLYSCDPSSCSTYYIANKSDTTITIYFARPDSPDYKDVIEHSTLQYTETLCETGGVAITLSDCDSIYITDVHENILKVYKEDTEGKNIYNIDEDWSKHKAGKRDYEYTFSITNEDLE